MYKSPANLARCEVEELRRCFAPLLEKAPISASTLARRLGIIVDVSPDLREPGRLEHRASQQRSSFTIRVNAKLPTANKRVVVAHEIGHAVLAYKYPDMAQSWDLRRREQFAHAFAREVLIPPSYRPELEGAIRIASDPMELLKLADRLGIPPAIAFALAGEHSWCDGSRIWLRVSFRHNSVTGRDPKLRVVAALYDRKIWYLPLNISVESLGLDVQWLLSLGAGYAVCRKAILRLWERSELRKPRYRKVDETVWVSAVRLKSVHVEEQRYIVVAERASSAVAASKADT